MFVWNRWMYNMLWVKEWASKQANEWVSEWVSASGCGCMFSLYCNMNVYMDEMLMRSDIAKECIDICIHISTFYRRSFNIIKFWSKRNKEREREWEIWKDAGIEREKTLNGKLEKELDLTQLDSNQMKILYTHPHTANIKFSHVLVHLVVHTCWAL